MTGPSWSAGSRPSSNGQTLITTRSRRHDGSGAPIDLRLLDPASARDLLTRDYPPESDEEAAVVAILERLAGHALALDVAHAACRRQGYRGFLERLERPDRDALALAAELAPELPSGHDPDIAATFLSSIRELGVEGLDFLRLAAQLSAAPVERWLFAGCLAEADSLEQTEAEDRADRGMGEAIALSLAEEASGEAASVHTLIARTVRFRDTSRERQGELRRAAVGVLNRRLSAVGDIRNHAVLTHALSHAQLLAEGTDQETEAGLSLKGWLGRYELARGRYRAARGWYQAGCRVPSGAGRGAPGHADLDGQPGRTLGPRGTCRERGGCRSRYWRSAVGCWARDT